MLLSLKARITGLNLMIPGLVPTITAISSLSSLFLRTLSIDFSQDTIREIAENYLSKIDLVAFENVEMTTPIVPIQINDILIRILNRCYQVRTQKTEFGSAYFLSTDVYIAKDLYAVLRLK